jgi:hypothetical protein
MAAPAGSVGFAVPVAFAMAGAPAAGAMSACANQATASAGAAAAGCAGATVVPDSPVPVAVAGMEPALVLAALRPRALAITLPKSALASAGAS